MVREICAALALVIAAMVRIAATELFCRGARQLLRTHFDFERQIFTCLACGQDFHPSLTQTESMVRSSSAIELAASTGKTLADIQR